MKICYSTLNYSKKTYESLNDNLEAISKNGFNAIDLAIFEGWQNISTIKLVKDEKYYNEMVKIIKNSRLNIPSINCGLSVMFSDNSDNTIDIIKNESKAVFRFANDIRCPIVVMQPGAIINENFNKSLDVAKKNMIVIGKLAKDMGIKLAIESHEGSLLENPIIGLEFFKESWPDVGACYDPSHYEMQDIELEKTFGILDYTYMVHLRCSTSKMMQCTMVENTFDIENVINKLKVKNYDYYVSIEYFNGFGDDEIEPQKLSKLLLSNGLDI